VRALVHSFSFLLGDILRRWLENPLSFLAKTVITVVLVAIASIVLISFYVSENLLEARVSELGGDVVVVRESFRVLDPSQRGYAIVDFVQKSSDVELSSAILVPGSARTEFGTTASIFTSREPSPDSSPAQSAVLYSDSYAEGLVTSVEALDVRISAITRAKPEWIRRVASGDVVFLPYRLCRERVSQAHEMISVLKVRGDASGAVELAHTLQRVIEAENRQTVRLFSPEDLLLELDQLRANQKLWRIAIALGMGSAMAIILSVLSLLEYKQWEFYAALLRSFGMPSVFIYIRYVVEALIPTLLAAAATIWAVAASADAVFPSIGVDIAALQYLAILPFMIDEGFTLIAFLATGVTLGSLPVAYLVRKPIGRVMA